MNKEEETVDSFLPLSIKSDIDPMEFDVTVCALLVSLGADKYINIFREKNIGMSTLPELTDEDLIKLGVDDPLIRKTLMSEVKNLPIYEETATQWSKTMLCLGPMEVADLLEETSQQLYRIYLSMLANTLAIKKTKHITDCLVYENKYASDIALTTLREITNLVNSMDITLRTHPELQKKDNSKKRHKKVIIGTVGSVAIAVLAVLFVRSLKQLKK